MDGVLYYKRSNVPQIRSSTHHGSLEALVMMVLEAVPVKPANLDAHFGITSCVGDVIKAAGDDLSRWSLGLLKKQRQKRKKVGRFSSRHADWLVAGTTAM
jgi:hypothetical protein